MNRDRTFRPAQIVRRARPLVGHPRVRFFVHRVGKGHCRIQRLPAAQRPRLRPAGRDPRRARTRRSPTCSITPGSRCTPVSLLLGPMRRYVRHRGDPRATSRSRPASTGALDASAGLAARVAGGGDPRRDHAQLCQFEETGAIVAAMTTSIPEAPTPAQLGLSLLLAARRLLRRPALNSLSEWHDGGLPPLAQRRGSRCGGGHVQPLYGIGLEQKLPERTRRPLRLPRHGAGRVGNQALEQCSTTSTATSSWAPRRRSSTRDFSAGPTCAIPRAGGGRRAGLATARPARCRHVGAAHARPRPHLLVAACAGPPATGWPRSPPRRRARARTIRRDAGRHIRAEDPRAVLERRAPGLRRELRRHGPGRERSADGRGGLHRADRSALVKTVAALEAALCDGPFMRRYEAPDDFGRPETAFNFCSFWRIDALARIGRGEEAREIFEALLASRNAVGLLSEDLHAEPASCGATSRRPTRWSASSTARCGSRSHGTPSCERAERLRPRSIASAAAIRT